ncbi:hypothetical protein KNT81_gp067 [Proteus phage phiP4-3]|uniref:Uncharacterized protein n=1 Tax=Proteus phage phiP4-3 TaxID=2065203 RepID=A0A2I6PFB5_9CAUD|nr:hypothetical protein KNT81_gp067 [Proteus phage phiP4-3]AUM58425.1 hypothetical protein phiP43_067 [Proteus phage phiP4-3]
MKSLDNHQKNILIDDLEEQIESIFMNSLISFKLDKSCPIRESDFHKILAIQDDLSKII